MKVLITGVAGSGGSYLADYITQNHPDVEVHGLARWHSTTNIDNVKQIRGKITVHQCDMLDLGSMIRVVRRIRPDRIFNLASHANVRVCFDDPIAVYSNNVLLMHNLLEAVRFEAPEAMIQQCSTSEVYGTPLITPIREDHPIIAVNPYAASKISQEALCHAYFKSFGLRVIFTRMFAYINPRRRDLFATSFAYQIAKIEQDAKENLDYDQVIRHGNLDSIRTIIDVRDAMETYWIACEHCTPGEAYNIGGKYTATVGDVLNILKSLAKVPVVSRQDPALMRPVDMTKQIPDTTKFDSLTGWKPRYSIEESLDFLLNHVRKEVERKT